MDIGGNLSNSFEYAKKLLSDAGRLIILIVLDLIPIVNWIVVGYAARVLKETPASDTPPKLEKYGELFVDGAKVFFATLVYMLVPTVLIAAGGFSLFAGMSVFQGGVAPSFAFGGIGVVLLIIGIVLAIVMLVIFAMGMAHMVKTGKFGKAFAFGEILSIIRAVGWGKYLVWIVVIIVISVVVGAVAGFIPFVGWIIAAIIQPGLIVFVFRSTGLLYNDGAPPELRTQPSPVAGLACPSCGTPLQPHHKFCPNCGAAAPVPPAPPPPAPSSTEPTRFCTSCGTKIPASAKFCGSCGAKQT